VNKLRTDAINTSLERTLTRDRLSKYLAETGGNLDEALTLYEQNTRLSEALYSPLQSMEICFRNTINHNMQVVYGEDWLRSGAPPLGVSETEKISEAWAELRAPTHSQLVATLKFSFWVGLVAPKYDGTLWRHSIYKGFSVGAGKKRRDVHGRFNALRRFRNRVAHHEPVYIKAEQMHRETIEAIGWMCRDTQIWAESQSNFADVYRP